MSAHEDRGSDRRSDDELTRRYHEANGQDMSRPGPHVRLLVQEHARAVLEAQKQIRSTPPVTSREAANQPRWKMSMLASIALAGLTGLLVLQFDRGTPEEKDLALGQPGASANAPLPVAVPPPLPSPAPPAPASGAAPERLPTPARKPVPPAAAAAPSSEQQESRKAASTGVEAATVAAPATDSANRSRDASADRESGAATPPQFPLPSPSPSLSPSPSPFPASPPAAAAPAAAPPPAPPRVMMAPAPATAAKAAPSLQRSESLAAPRAVQSARGVADGPSSLLQAATTGSTAEIARLQQQGAPLNGTDEAGRTPLMLAAINGHEAAVKQLLSLGANRALLDREGLSALDHARRQGKTGIAAVLALP